MIDKQARQKTAQLLEDFMSKKIKTAEFVSELEEIGIMTQDHLIHQACYKIGDRFRDEDNKHISVNSKEEEYLTQFLAELKTEKEYEYGHNWGITQFIALAALIAFLIHLSSAGWKSYLYTLSIPYGIISISIIIWERVVVKYKKNDPYLFLKDFPAKPSVVELIIAVSVLGIIEIFISPVLLLIQSFPATALKQKS